MTKNLRTALLISPLLIGLAAPALAQDPIAEGPAPADPVLADAERYAEPNFFLNDNQDRELIRYSSPRNLQICAASAKVKRDGRPGRGYPLQVTYDSTTAVVSPGTCLSFEAKRVQVRAASPLPDNMILEGSLREVATPAG